MAFNEATVHLVTLTFSLDYLFRKFEILRLLVFALSVRLCASCISPHIRQDASWILPTLLASLGNVRTSRCQSSTIPSKTQYESEMTLQSLGSPGLKFGGKALNRQVVASSELSPYLLWKAKYHDRFGFYHIGVRRRSHVSCYQRCCCHSPSFSSIFCPILLLALKAFLVIMLQLDLELPNSCHGLLLTFVLSIENSYDIAAPMRPSRSYGE